ncbi:hypothetical protein [Roseivirga thermotolerans]|uniref:hypothetical protein n=1 Tax=Roseivirga thermotolerans TaxID=1758176 RepID=UPI00273D4D23|nr:hypothetical protein [Roseivirga thermotolerans]
MLINLSKRLICLTFGLLLIFSCSPEELPIEIPFYFYDFESGYTNIDSVYVSEFDGDKVLGPFNNSGFSVQWQGLPKHDYVKLTFDLYIHDTWEGNSNDSGTGLPDHDAWIIEFDPHKNVKSSEKIYFETTFSNGPCEPGWCFGQSYPNEFPFYHDARTGAAVKYMQGRCLYADSPYGTSLYKIEKIFPHRESSMVIAFYDRLKQDAPFPPLCEESWSLDNLNISLIRR